VLKGPVPVVPDDQPLLVEERLKKFSEVVEKVV
jgi:hypothetical protein